MTKYRYTPGHLLEQNRYKIVRYLAAGGMQEVYEAQDRLIGRRLAIKVPISGSGLKRFDRSAILSAKVNHPNTTRTFDYFVVDGTPHLVEELVDGCDLSKVLLQIPAIDPHTAAYIFHHLVRGLQAVARPGLVHRDLKPSNIMIENGLKMSGVKITDFGVASMAGDQIEAAVEGGTTSISASRTAIGALPYMAPEVIDEPKSRIQASDIWSIGAIGFELLTATKPFGQGLRATVKILEAKVPPLPESVGQNIQFGTLARELYGILLLCLSKDPSVRPTADNLLSLCGRLCYQPPTDRLEGRVKSYPNRSFGFISSPGSKDSFFHVESVFGGRPEIGDRVWYRPWLGQPADRAHPVVLMAKDIVT